MLLEDINALSSRAERGICFPLCDQEPVVIPNPRYLRVRDLLPAERGEEHRLRRRSFL